VPMKLEVYKEFRIVPVRFERGTIGDPDILYPDIDDRGHNFKIPACNDGIAESSEIRGPVVGVVKKRKIKVKLIREQIDPAAPLYITSSDENVVKVVTPSANSKLANGKSTLIELVGGNFVEETTKSARIEVRFESSTGPIVYEMNVYVSHPLTVKLQPYLVTLNGNTGSGGTKPSIDMNSVMKMVKALWAPCGIEFDIHPTKSFAVSMPTANIMRFTDVNTVLAAQWKAKAINIYIVKEIDGALGLGISKAVHAGFGINKPCVFAGMQSGGVARGHGDNYWWANDLAHELGHFFTLWHPSDSPNAIRYETWSMRFLMHNYNYTGRAGPPGASSDWPTFNNFDYGKHSSGNPFRAGLISLKNVRTGTSAGRDAQWSTSRNHILSGSANLY
jgi:hypothetical protein